MKPVWEIIVYVLSIVFYSLVAGLLFVLGSELVHWTFTYLMGTDLLTLFHEHKGLDAALELLANQRIMVLVLITGLLLYIYYHITEEND